MEIEIPEDDYFYGKYNVKCQDFVRAFPAVQPNCRLGESYKLHIGSVESYVYPHFPAFITNNNKYISTNRCRYIGLQRATSCFDVSGSRTPFNTLTGVIDANTVYGVTDTLARYNASRFQKFREMGILT